MESSLAAALGASVVGVATGSETEIPERDTVGAPGVVGSIKRLSTTAFGAEVTGPFVFENGNLLYSLQHPATGQRGDGFVNGGAKANESPYDRAGVGYFSGFSFEFDGDNDDFEEQPIPTTVEEQGQVLSANHEFVMLAQAREQINGGSELLGVTQTPDGTNVTQDNFQGTQYGAAATNPDCNQFVPTDDEGTEGYLFTNWENSPGNISRVPISMTEDGEWEADTDEAINLANTEPLRDLGGTRINCYGDLTPWNTMVSSEENYAHPRVSLTSTVGDIVDAGTGKGTIGGCQFWNRPNPTSIQGALEDYYGDGNGWYVQGYWALDGVEFLAYYLGAEQVDQGGDENTTDPISDVYPNPYRYGYHVDFREPAADPPQPVKYYVMGRASWEAPDFVGDRKTVYGCSDGDNKGIYKFVADERIDSYDDPMDLEGTLYAPKITNDAASVEDGGDRANPAETDLEVEWIPLGHASNRECEAWIAAYDDVTQVDYLEAHTEDWTEGDEVTDDVLAEADRTVIEEGNQNYITNEEIVAWAEQYEEEGPDGVDDDLRRVPFLETRAAAKEIGASIEFNKAEGVDSRDDAEPGEFVYFGISEFNDALADEEGDIRMERVDGGIVYRGELEPDYNVSRLEPVIVGPDFGVQTDQYPDGDDGVANIDNVYTMRDGRVICCEDGFNEGPASFPNDAMYVYQPPVDVDVESAAVANGSSAEVDLTASSLPDGFSGAKVTVELSHPDVAEITGASYADELGVTAEPQLAGDGSAVTVRTADIEGAVQPGAMNVTLATLEVEGTGAGTTDLNVVVNDMDDEAGADIDVQERSGVVITGPPAVGSGPGGRPPTDPDGDGFF
jgi:secreted PhoX family phosphatase